MRMVCVEEIIKEAWIQVENNNFNNAIEMLEQAIIDFEDNQYIILLELSKIYFENKQYLRALEKFMIYYNYSKDKQILNFLLECYYEPNSDEYRKVYNENKNIKNYKYFYGKMPEFKYIESKILWHDKKIIIYYYFDEIIKIEFNNDDSDKSDMKNEIVILINQYDLNTILEYEEVTKRDFNFLTMKIPMYLYYDEQFFLVISQLVEFRTVIEKDRIVIIVGENELKDFFYDTQAIFPKYILGSNAYKYLNILKYCLKRINYYHNKFKREIKEYYEHNSLKVLQNIINKSPKILFITTRFSTVLQYHVRDSKEAADKIGLKTDLLIEKSDIHRIGDAARLELIHKLKPDIIFFIDHFRFEYSNIPKEIVWLTWTQDPLPYIMDKDTPSKLFERDIVLNHFFTWDEFAKLNYPKDRLFDAPVPSNNNIYKSYEISDKEKEDYSCDICFVCHAADFEEELNSFLERITDITIRGYLRRIANEYYNTAYEKGEFYYSKYDFKVFSVKLLNSWNIKLDNHILYEFVEEMHLWLNQRVFRQVLVNWLIDAGYKNIKLWGSGWTKYEKYKKYAMGPAENGEQLSKIYQCSKINVGNNIVITSAARAWESMLSGGFYMSNYIPPENDITDIRKILRDDEFVMFYDKEDFLAKVKYYLEHEDKRLEMIEIGKKCALERMTFENLMKNTLENIVKYYKERI